uniref:Uncharacterized protein n=1 Tax=Tetraselmis sp. GSL018 TaxID=582737 RepID=A0A061SFL7_9CHLO
MEPNIRESPPKSRTCHFVGCVMHILSPCVV